MTDYQISLDKTLVLDVCEPYMIVETVRHLAANDSFQIFVFAHFEVDDEEYIFGCEENEYKYCLEHDKKRIPVIIARVHRLLGVPRFNSLVQTGGFYPEELSTLEETITYTLESQRVASKYMQRCM